MRRETEIRALLAQMTEAEKLELLRFVEYLHACQENGHTVTREEALEMSSAARERINQAERMSA